MILPWIILLGSTLVYGLLLTSITSRLRPVSLQGEVLQRKIFHVGIFTGAVPAQFSLGFWGVVLYGATIAGLVFLAALRGTESSLFRVLDRVGEGEGRAGILLPLGATALGGILGVLLVGEFAMVGYLTCGWGDAAGEIIGRMWGKHPYADLFPRWIPSQRTLEGTLGVLLLGFLGGWAALGILGYGILPALGVGAVVGIVASVAEGLSWKGTDNLWVQLLPSLVAWWLLG